MPALQQPLPFTVLKPALPDGQKHHLLQCCNSPYRLRYWNKPTVLIPLWLSIKLQQPLPFTVLKHVASIVRNLAHWRVATALTVYGIETNQEFYYHHEQLQQLQQPLPFTVLKRSDMMWYRLLPSPRCNSPYRLRYWNSGHSTLMPPSISVATVLIVYGIETWTTINSPPSSLLKLQQYLLFTVLKHSY